MDNALAGTDFANDHIEEVPKWTAAMEDRGVYPKSRASNSLTALAQLLTVLADDEPRTVGYMLENVEAVASRWAVKTAANPATARTYLIRTKSVLEHYLQYKTKPTGFRVEAPRASSDDQRQRPARKTSREREDRREREEQRTPTTGSPAAPPSPAMREFPLANGRVFRYVMPEDMTLKEAKKVIYHLATMCVDFDPDGGFGVAPGGGLTFTRHD